MASDVRVEGAAVYSDGAAAEMHGVDRRVMPRYCLVEKGLMEHLALAGSSQIEVVASNISVTGILLHTNHGSTLAPDDLLSVTFTPLYEGELITVKVRVVWIRQHMVHDLGNCTFGCYFFETPQETVNRLLAPAREAAALKTIQEPY